MKQSSSAKATSLSCKPIHTKITKHLITHRVNRKAKCCANCCWYDGYDGGFAATGDPEQLTRSGDLLEGHRTKGANRHVL